MAKMEVYTIDEVKAMINIIEYVQDRLAGELELDDEWDMLEEVLCILTQVG